ncbi:glycosyltransferase family A protein [Kitasatospora sp. NPDC094015]|uniref:glycosyltransferase family 2 protein n=1 Tax=Kitasatospora sp. NPDC094015 TaxID=3155205 RepID=UPI0033183208
MTVADVSVVIAVHDAAPHLADCLASLAGQSIGAGRAEVVAVDLRPSGGEQLRRFAARYPGRCVLLGPADAAGGPGHPLDLATAHARGRYLLRLGADQRLDTEALERLVDAADRWSSDVLLARTAGEPARGLRAATAARVAFADPAPAGGSGGALLLRRELVVRHGLRRRPDLPALAEQPFAVAALLLARRISVLADHEHVHPVPGPAGPPDLREELRAVRAVQELVERAGPGPAREAIRRRHFGRDLPRLLRPPFLALTAPDQEDLLREVGRLVDRHCSPGLFVRLPVAARLRLALARRGERAALCGLIAYEAVHGTPPAVRRAGRSYAGYPVFRDARLGLPDALFELPGGPAVRPPGWRRLVPRRVRRSARGWRRAWRDARPVKAAGS